MGTTDTRPLWKLPFSRGELADLLKAMAKAAHLAGAHVELLVVGDGKMSRLHHSSLGRRGPTNILSFPLGPLGQELGSLVLSADTLQRECLLYEQAPEDHCIRLLAHGFAHLLGHEHGQDMENLCLRLEEEARSMILKKP